MATFYRICNRRNVGPYHTGHVPDREEFQDNERHPTPGMEGIPFYGYDQICGFTTLEQLQAWFDDSMLYAIANDLEWSTFAADPDPIPQFIVAFETEPDYIQPGIKQATAFDWSLRPVAYAPIPEFLESRTLCHPITSLNELS